MSRGRAENNAGKSGGRSNDAKKKPPLKAKSTAKPKRSGASADGRKSAPKAKAPEKKRTISSREKGKYIDFKDRQRTGDPLPTFKDEVRLNKYLSNAGICSRRDADVLIQTGLVRVNDVVITEMGYKVKPSDVVKYDGGTINTATKRYVLLNKPKGFVTSMDDPFGTKNAIGLVRNACKEAIYPIGKLDKDTTGLVLFTNDTDLEKKLNHPKHRPARLYHVVLTRKVRVEDIEKLREGILLEDGTTRFHNVQYVEDSDSRELGLEIFTGKNQVVRRAMEALGYTVSKLDRVMFAGLTKKDLPRGRCRHLTEKEVSFLKMN